LRAGQIQFLALYGSGSRSAQASGFQTDTVHETGAGVTWSPQEVGRRDTLSGDGKFRSQASAGITDPPMRNSERGFQSATRTRSLQKSAVLDFPDRAADDVVFDSKRKASERFLIVDLMRSASAVHYERGFARNKPGPWRDRNDGKADGFPSGRRSRLSQSWLPRASIGAPELRANFRQRATAPG